MKIRAGVCQDSAALAELSGQLGYPVSTQTFESRYSGILENEQHAVFVAVDEQMGMVGWIHVRICELLLVERRALIGGLIVDERYRNRGIGALLVKRAETWAREMDCTAICVKSNVQRSESHPFYEKLGFCRVKTQNSYVLDFSWSGPEEGTPG